MEKITIIIIWKSDFCILASGLLKRKKPPYMDHAVKAARTKASKSQLRILLHLYWDSLYALTICWLENILVPLYQIIDMALSVSVYALVDWTQLWLMLVLQRIG